MSYAITYFFTFFIVQKSIYKDCENLPKPFEVLQRRVTKNCIKFDPDMMHCYALQVKFKRNIRSMS